MANKYKEVFPNNLFKIREELGYTQKQMGEKLKVCEKTIRNYETYETNFPLEKAMYLSKEFNYTLDWIYCNADKMKKHTLGNDSESSFPKYNIDIRDFISYSNGMVHFTIPNYYWDYIKTRNAITSSNRSLFEKKREIAKLEAKFKAKKPEGQCRRFSLLETNFSSYIHFDEKFIPYADAESQEKYVPTDEQVAEFQSFFNQMINP